MTNGRMVRRMVLLGLLITVGIVATVYAQPLRESTTFYYTDSTKTVQCGDREIFCDGLIVYSGCYTAYRTIFYGEYCPGNCNPTEC